MSDNLAVVADSPSDLHKAMVFSEKHGMPLLSLEPEASTAFSVIHFSGDRVYISWPGPKKRLHLELDFSAGGADHRRKFGGGKGQLIAKAVGLASTKKRLRVLDCTAGQGGDAFVLACLGCSVRMFERSVVAYTLLQNALERAVGYAQHEDPELLHILERMTLEYGDVRELLADTKEIFDVIYLDPMFPSRKKAALVKKEMQLFHTLIGEDSDTSDLLDKLGPFAEYRIVVKRSKGAPHLSQRKPTYELKGKSIRYDIYVNKGLTSSL